MRRLAFVSDLHVGSKYGLSPEPETEGQEELWRSWCEFTAEAMQRQVEVLFVVGDLLHGMNPKERGRGLVTADLNEQVDLATKVLETWSWCPKKLLFLGSRYHASMEGFYPEQEVCQRIGGTWCGALRFVRVANTPYRVFVTHEVSPWMYQSGALERDLIWAAAAARFGKIPPVDLVVQGHVHKFRYLRTAGMHSVTLPAWAMFTPWRPSLMAIARHHPDIGGVFVTMDDLGIVVEPRLFPTPRTKFEQDLMV